MSVAAIRSLPAYIKDDIAVRFHVVSGLARQPVSDVVYVAVHELNTDTKHHYAVWHSVVAIQIGRSLNGGGKEFNVPKFYVLSITKIVRLPGRIIENETIVIRPEIQAGVLTRVRTDINWIARGPVQVWEPNIRPWGNVDPSPKVESIPRLNNCNLLVQCSG